MSVLAVGTVAFDTIQTPFGRVEQVLGGSATYLSVAARYFAPEIDVVAVVGRDFPNEFLDVLRGRGVGLEGVQIEQSGLTFAWEGRYGSDLNDRETLATHLNVLVDFDPLVPEALRDARIVCLGNLDPTIQLKALQQMRRPEIVICDTMNYWIDHTPDALRLLLSKVDCLIINDSEARQISGETNLVRGAAAIIKLGPRVLVIKKGEHGALLFAEETVFSAPAFPLEDIHDPTGAGDAFMGGFAGYLASRRSFKVDDLRSAVVCGSVMASFTVERFGVDRLLELSSDSVVDRLSAFRELARIPAVAPVGTVAPAE